MVEFPTRTLVGHDHILYYHIGSIVMGMQGVHQSLTRLLAYAKIIDHPDEFMKRRELWSSTARRMIEGHGAALLTELRKIEGTINKMHHLRDALVHGNPFVRIYHEPVMVECWISPKKSRYRQDFVRHIQRMYRGTERYKMMASVARLVAKGGTYPLQVSYEFDDIAKASRTLDDLISDIGNLSMKIKRCQPDYGPEHGVA